MKLFQAILICLVFCCRQGNLQDPATSSSMVATSPGLSDVGTQTSPKPSADVITLSQNETLKSSEAASQGYGISSTSKIISVQYTSTFPTIPGHDVNSTLEKISVPGNSSSSMPSGEYTSQSSKLIQGHDNNLTTVRTLTLNSSTISLLNLSTNTAVQGYGNKSTSKMVSILGVSAVTSLPLSSNKYQASTSVQRQNVGAILSSKHVHQFLVMLSYYLAIYLLY